MNQYLEKVSLILEKMAKTRNKRISKNTLLQEVRSDLTDKAVNGSIKQVFKNSNRRVRKTVEAGQAAHKIIKMRRVKKNVKTG